jgi:hypothetical protein
MIGGQYGLNLAQISLGSMSVFVARSAPIYLLEVA